MAGIVIGVLAAVVLSAGFVDANGYSNYYMPEYGLGYQFYVPNPFVSDKNAPCVIRNGDLNLEGSCTNLFDCNLSGGRSPARGNCSLINTCCIHQNICGQTSRNRVTYFKNPTQFRDQPCTLNVEKVKENVCQMRVDIINMDIGGPDEDTSPFTIKCGKNSFQVSNGANGMFSTCGQENNNHFYIHLDREQNHAYFTMQLDNVNENKQKTNKQKTWNIKITQLECPSREIKHSWSTKKENRNQAADDFRKLAPPGCLQYHTEYSGTVRSFNYEGNLMTTGNDYAICFKRYSNCDIQFTATDCQIGNEPQLAVTCNKHYIFVPESISTGIFQKRNKICVVLAGLSPPILTEKHPGPLYIHVKNEDEAPEKPTGFSIDYDKACS